MIDNVNIEIIDDQMAEILRKKTPQERIDIAFKMWDSARKMLINYFHTTHPDWDDDKIKKKTAERLSHGSI